MNRKLPRLPRLHTLRVPRAKLPELKTPAAPRNVAEVLPGKLTARGSSWETVVDAYLRKRDPNWLYQNGGTALVPRGSIPDWTHPLKMVALYLDGPQHRLRMKEPHDVLLRASIASLGYHVVEWKVDDLGYLMRNIDTWYARDIG